MKTPQKRRVSLAKSKLQANTTFRMNILFFVIFLLFSVLILRLGYLQIVKGEDYSRAIARTEEVAVNTSVPRGRIFDAAGRLQVDNEPVNSITYTAMQTTKRDEMLEVATELAKLIEKDTDKVTLRDHCFNRAKRCAVLRCLADFFDHMRLHAVAVVGDR